MILEGIVTTRNLEGQINIAPMGPIVTPSMQSLVLKPFESSSTCQNLRHSKEGVFHVIDDVQLLARAAIHQLTDADSSTMPAIHVQGDVLKNACRWYEFRVTEIDDSSERYLMKADVIHTGKIQDFFGFNRAKHAVLEAAILATRVGLISKKEIQAQMDLLEIIVQKTAGKQETAAFALLKKYIESTETKTT